MENKDSYSPQEVAEMIRNRTLYTTEDSKGCASLGEPNPDYIKELDRQMPKNVMSILEKILKE